MWTLYTYVVIWLAKVVVGSCNIYISIMYGKSIDKRHTHDAKTSIGEKKRVWKARER